MSFENESQISKTSIQFAVVEGNVDPKIAQAEASFSIGTFQLQNEHTSGDLTSKKKTGFSFRIYLMLERRKPAIKWC